MGVTISYNVSMKKFTNKKQNIHNTINCTNFIIKLVSSQENGKKYFLTKILMAFIGVIFVILYTVIPGLIINELSSQKRINIIMIYVATLSIAPLINQLFNYIANRYIVQISTIINMNLKTNYFDTLASMNYELLENPDIQQMKYRASQMLNDTLNIINQLCDFISSIIRLITLSALILTLNPLILLLIFITIFLNSVVTKIANQKLYSISQYLMNYFTREQSVTWVFEDSSYAKEMRLFNLKSFFMNKFKENIQESLKLERRNYDVSSSPSIFNSATSSIQQMIVYCYLIFNVIKRGLSVGNMTIYMSAIGQVSGSLNQVFGSYVELSRKSLYIQDMIDFLNLKNDNKENGELIPSFTKDSTIEFKNVFFKYPGSERFVINNLSITIHGDEKLCIVGENGSGKTTFIKLLTGLYIPTQGEILLNGININKYNRDMYQKLFSPVFQDYCEYSLSLIENIAFSESDNKTLVDNICDKCNLTDLINDLPKGIYTQVGKYIDEEGFEPSGGEGQKIAIARACYHHGDIFLLDEPTAALDPVAEYEIYSHFNNMITDKCAILITHRLSAVQLVDKVAVFSNGAVIEYGTHSDLYSKGEIYTEMFNKQAQFYRDHPSSE